VSQGICFTPKFASDSKFDRQKSLGVILATVRQEIVDEVAESSAHSYSTLMQIVL